MENVLTPEQRAEILTDLQRQFEAAIIKEREHAFAEAFTLMWYRDEKTGRRERIWNSRNGVTPFCCTSRDGNTAQHVDWQQDETDTRHKPKVGDRIFVDCAPEMILKFELEKIERYWDHPDMPMRERWTTKHAAVIDLLRDSYASGVQPTLIEVTEELARKRHWLKAPKEKARFA